MKCTVCKMDIHFEICKAQISGCVSRMTVNRKGSPLENIQIYTRLCLPLLFTHARFSLWTHVSSGLL